jgi:hypothetical protein
MPLLVIPAKAGIQDGGESSAGLDPSFRWDDEGRSWDDESRSRDDESRSRDAERKELG